MNNRTFSWRIFTSFGLFLSFLMVLVSGVILYIFPGRSPGFVWQMMGLTRPAWEQQHIIFGFAFSLLSLCHLFFINWKAFLSYLKTKTAQGVKRPLELLAIVILSAFVGFGTYFGIQPFSAILQFGKVISRSWEPKSQQGPMRHAALMKITLTQLAEQPGLGGDADALEMKLGEAGLRVDSQRQTLGEIAAMNGVTAETVYGIITAKESTSEALQGEEREDRHHHDWQERADETAGSWRSHELAYLDEQVPAGNGTPVSTVSENSSSKLNGSQAPDDELHRRTTASCSSCH